MKKLFFILFSALLVISCNNETVTPVSEIQETMNLKVGNYWVYEWHEIDPSSNATLLNKKDSSIIERDSIINGRTYFVRSNNFFGSRQFTQSILFDSANAIYSYPDRRMLLTLDQSIVSTEQFGLADDSIAIGYYSIDNTEVTVQVPAGKFNAKNFKGHIESKQSNYPYGTRYNDNYYANKVGLIKMRTQMYSSPNDIEMQLVRFGNVKE